VEATKPPEPPMKRVAQGDLASLQAVTRVNAEQASKTMMQEPTHPKFGEGRRRGISNERLGLSDLPG